MAKKIINTLLFGTKFCDEILIVEKECKVVWWYGNVYKQKLSVIIVTMHTAKQGIKQTVQWLKKKKNTKKNTWKQKNKYLWITDSTKLTGKGPWLCHTG